MTNRFTVTVQHDGSPRLQLGVRAEAEDVTAAEVVHTLLRAALEFAAQPHARMPSVREVEAKERDAALLREHPAVRIYRRGERLVWLGKTARMEIGTKLLAAGWHDLGAVPENAQVACERARTGATDFDVVALAPEVEADAPAPTNGVAEAAQAPKTL
jgi:hypothetical protein